MKKKNLFAALLAIVLVLGTVFVWQNFSPSSQKGSKTIVINVDHLNGTDTTFTFKTKQEYLRGAMEEHNLVSGTEAEYGLWVTTVDGETADESQQEWWGYDVNGQQAAYGVDGQVIADGDVFDFTLHVGW